MAATISSMPSVPSTRPSASHTGTRLAGDSSALSKACRKLAPLHRDRVRRMGHVGVAIETQPRGWRRPSTASTQPPAREERSSSATTSDVSSGRPSMPWNCRLRSPRPAPRKLATKSLAGVREQRLRGIELRERPALLEDRDPVAEQDRLVDVVGDEDDGLAPARACSRSNSSCS